MNEQQFSEINDDDAVIGLINGCERTSLCTIKMLRDELRNNHFYSVKQYCDFRYATNLERFLYDPFTGKKIDWKKIYLSLLIK